MSIHLGNLYMKREAESRSLSAENYRGDKGKGAMDTVENAAHQGQARAARELGQGWKVSPCIAIAAGKSATIMDHEGPGVIRHMWMTLRPKQMRDTIIRVYWDGQEHPSIECPISDFMCQAWGWRQQVNSIPINVNSNGGMNCYLQMPFRKHARITIQNDSPDELEYFFYTVNYTLEEVPEDALYLHAQWRRENPTTPMKEYTIVEGVKGQGQYIGTFMSWQQNSKGWWGEGEIKMFLDGDGEFPTICGTGTEDYFGGAWGFRDGNYSAPYLGFQMCNGEMEKPGARYSLYRFHIPDPIFFKEDLRVTMQCLGWRSGHRYLPLQDDVSSVAYWYQTLPGEPFPDLPERNYREII